MVIFLEKASMKHVGTYTLNLISNDQQVNGYNHTHFFFFLHITNITWSYGIQGKTIKTLHKSLKAISIFKKASSHHFITCDLTSLYQCKLYHCII